MPNTLDTLHGRRSIRQFTTREPSRADIEALLDAAVTAPNHRLTQPWRFYVLGPEARHAYGLALGNRKAKKIEDPAAADGMRKKVAEEHASLPLMIAVALVEDADPGGGHGRDDDGRAEHRARRGVTWPWYASQVGRDHAGPRGARGARCTGWGADRRRAERRRAGNSTAREGAEERGVADEVAALNGDGQ